MYVGIFLPHNISTLLLTKHLSVGTFNISYFLVLWAVYFHNCIYFNITLTNDGPYDVLSTLQIHTLSVVKPQQWERVS